MLVILEGHSLRVVRVGLSEIGQNDTEIVATLILVIVAVTSFWTVAVAVFTSVAVLTRVAVLTTVNVFVLTICTTEREVAVSVSRIVVGTIDIETLVVVTVSVSVTRTVVGTNFVVSTV